MTHGSPAQIAARLTELIEPWGTVTAEDRWMPHGFADLEEAQLHKAPRLLPRNVCSDLQSWWLAVRATTPNWDMASTCTIEGKKGMLLVEAKAHDAELIGEEIGKRLDRNASSNSRRNHDQIGDAIKQANAATGWHLSRDSHYQMSNRFAWAWKLTGLGFPVILVYLGFTYAIEMSDKGNPFTSHGEWEKLVRSHSEPLFPAHIWDSRLILHGQVFIPLIRSVSCGLEAGNDVAARR